MALNETLDQMDLIDIYRTFHPKTAEYTFFSSTHGMFSKVDNVLGHKISLNEFKRTEIILNTSLTTMLMKLEITRNKIGQTQTSGD